ncbi:MAG: gamma-butyrobetaine hydroxylase-like domain-containing protein [Bacteroidota bacterium]
MNQTFGNRRRAIEIRLKRAERLIEIDFDDGRSCRLPAELLRVESPSAEVQGHDPRRKTIVAGKRHVGISGVEPVGTYALRIRFDDGHDTGLYTWDWLYNLGEDQERIWRTYLDALAERGLSREPVPARPRVTKS